MTDFYKNNDDQIRDKLTQHEFAPVSGAWENMSKLLDQQQTVPKAAGAWWWSLPLVAAAVLTGIISVGMYLNKNQALGEQALAIQEKGDQPEMALTKEKLVNISSSNSKNIVNESVVNHSTANSNSTAGVTTNFATHSTTTVATSSNSTKETSVATTTKATKEVAKNKRTKVKKSNANTTSTLIAATNSTQMVDAQNVNSSNVVADNQAIVEENDKALDGSNTTNNAAGNKKVKTTKTIVSYQYSITPLMELQAKRKLLKEPEPIIGNFGISEEFNKPNCPVKIGVFTGASAKMYGSTKKISVMPTAGVTASYKVAPRHELQIGAQYKAMTQLPDKQSNENSSLTYQSGQNNYRSHAVTRIDMLEIPLVYKFYIHQKFNVQAGIKAAWVLNTETTNPNFNQLSNKDLGVADFDFGMLFGLEYLINKHWSLGLQYSLGFINLTAVGTQKQEESLQQDALNGVNPQDKVSSLSTSGEIVVPVTSDANNHEILRLPSNLHNNDIQLLLKYTF